MSGPIDAAKKKQILDLLSEGLTVAEALAQFDPPIGESTFYRLRRADQEWDKQIKQITQFRAARGPETKGVIGTRLFDPDRKIPKDIPFAEWRMRYLGRPSHPLHEAIAKAMEDSTTSRTVILAPPGGGKDTTVGDTVLKIKTRDRKYTRVAWIMEDEDFSKRRISERLAPYLTDPEVYNAAPVDTIGAQVPTHSLINDFGPFKHAPGMKYPSGAPVMRTTWNSSAMRFLQSARAPEADPDLWATGMKGKLYGSRVRLMVWSDLFTAENQINPIVRASQFNWITKTAFNRMDATGRLVVIGTRVAPDDNYERLIQWLVPEGTPVSWSETDGALTVTKYRNGVQIITCKAIWEDENGVEHSYWPERFPLEDQWLDEETGAHYSMDEITEEYAEAHGWVRAEGLLSVRARDPEVFECVHQQNPRVDGTVADFKPELLDLCGELGKDRRFGEYPRNTMLVHSVDPARAQGAAWAMLAADFETRRIYLVDFDWRERLGINGIKQQLILGPAHTYQPDWLVYEGNHEQGIMHSPDITGVLDTMGAQVAIVRTGDKRADPVVGIASVAKEMRQGRLIIPTARPEDQVRFSKVRRHFLNWDANPKATRTQKPGKEPDDIAMAVSFGVLHIRDLFERLDAKLKKRQEQQSGARRRGVPRIVTERYTARGGQGRHEKPSTPPVTGAEIQEVLEELMSA